MGLFDFIRRKRRGTQRELFEDTDPFSLGGTLKNLAAQGAESFARGEVPEARLIPHHAIKRDIIISAYTKDFEHSLAQVTSMAWTGAEKATRIEQMKADFAKHVYGVRRLNWQELDQIVALMKRTRTDLQEIERQVRDKTPAYRIVDPF